MCSTHWQQRVAVVGRVPRHLALLLLEHSTLLLSWLLHKQRHQPQCLYHPRLLLYQLEPQAQLMPQLWMQVYPRPQQQHPQLQP